MLGCGFVFFHFLFVCIGLHDGLHKMKNFCLAKEAIEREIKELKQLQKCRLYI